MGISPVSLGRLDRCLLCSVERHQKFGQGSSVLSKVKRCRNVSL